MFDEFDNTDFSEDVKISPDSREKGQNFSLDEKIIKVILTDVEINQAVEENHFRATERGVDEQGVHFIKEFYRRDPTGRLVANDNVAGVSELKNIPIPHDLLGECPGYFGVHDNTYAVCIKGDGVAILVNEDPQEFIVMCDLCFSRDKTYQNWEKRLFFIPKFLRHLLFDIQTLD